ncbi:PIR protein [Plasmodium vivax]|nr:PIR protein [Plasmodium vivax]
MVEVYFEVPTGRGKLDDNGCIELFFDIEEEIKKKIGELEITQGENHIHNKCQEIDQYLQKQKNSHNECFQDSFKIYVTDIEKEANALLSESSVYSQYCKSLTSKDEELTKLKGKTVELGKEKGNPVPENLPAERSSQTTAHCKGKPCKGESSENQALSVANPTDSHEPSTGSAQITSRPSEGTAVIVDSPSAAPTASELGKGRSDTCKETSCPSKGLSSSDHSTTEGSESHLSTPSSKTNVLNIPNPTITSEDYIGDISNTIFRKSLPHYTNAHCELNIDKGSKDSDGNFTTIKLLDCGTENAEYTISKNNNYEDYDITANSQTSFQTDIPLSSPSNEGDMQFQKVTSPERHHLSQGMKTTEQPQSYQPESLEEGKAKVTQALNNRGASKRQEMPDKTIESFFQRHHNAGTHFQSLSTYNNENHDTLPTHVRTAQSYDTSYKEATQNGISAGYILNKDSYPRGEQGSIDIEDTELSTPLEEPSLKMYTTIIAMILGGILFFALLSKFTPLGTLFSRKKKKKKKEIEKKLQRILSGEASIEERNVYMPYGQLRY